MIDAEGTEQMTHLNSGASGSPPGTPKSAPPTVDHRAYPLVMNLFSFKHLNATFSEHRKSLSSSRHRHRRPASMPISRKKSCVRCRAAKARCSLTHPRCTRCVGRGLRCDYAEQAPRFAPYSGATSVDTSLPTGVPAPNSDLASGISGGEQLEYEPHEVRTAYTQPSMTTSLGGTLDRSAGFIDWNDVDLQSAHPECFLVPNPLDTSNPHGTANLLNDLSTGFDLMNNDQAHDDSEALFVGEIDRASDGSTSTQTIRRSRLLAKRSAVTAHE
ncbi:hypothetical protein G7046_g92 [Stylonectria norvegica]|nr:hypothetical protein G7046_g92 [Stylonectria norvegica]